MRKVKRNKGGLCEDCERVTKNQMEKIELYQTVRLVTEKYANDGLHKGMIGTILEQWDEENFEIEWYDNKGDVVTIFSFRREEFELV